MFIRHERNEVFSIRVVIPLLALILSIPLLLIHTVSGNDAAVADDLGSNSGDGHTPAHQVENTPNHSLFLPLRQRMAEGKRNHLPSYEDFCFPINGKDRKGVQHGQEDVRYTPSKEKAICKGTKAANAELLTWSTEAVDAPRYFNYLSTRAIAVDANNQPHVVYGGDHLYHAYYNEGSWHYETVDSSGTVGYLASIALDSDSHIHICYYDELNRTLKYTTNASGAWVAINVGAGGCNSIAVDASGHVHISYTDDYRLKYTTNVSGKWVTTIIDYGNHFLDNSIAVDAAGYAHISYYGSWSLKYATNVSGEWIIATVDTPEIGQDNSIAVDASGHAHISYHGHGLMYATNISGAWVTAMVDSKAFWPLYTSLALDKAGHVCIGYYRSNSLMYAANLSGSWVTTTVDNNGDAGLFTSLAVDVSGNSHISYVENNNHNLKYATNASGAWETALIDQSKFRGGGLLALDTFGNAHISYWGNSLLYATNTSGKWVTTKVDVSNYAGADSMAIDTNNNIHISYYDGALKYATNASGAWVTTTVDKGKSNGVGEDSSIAIDSSGYVHISYLDMEKNYLKYATNVGGVWITTSVEQYGDTGSHTSIAVDDSSHAHISYYGGDYNHTALHYVTNASGIWVSKSVDTTQYAGFDSSLKLDAIGKVHISYVGYSERYELKYTTNKSGKWVTTIVESQERVRYEDGGFYCTNLELDKKGNAHISYSDAANIILKYATNASGMWTETTVGTGGFNSMELDANGRVHISYQDPLSYDLMYTTSLHPPMAVTNPSTHVTKTSASLNATVNANRLQTEIWLEWGTDSGGPYPNTSPKRVFDGEKDQKVRYAAQWLTKATKYYYHVVAENEDGISYGDEVSFKTKR